MSGHLTERPEQGGPPDWEALARYLAGEGSDVERARVRAWLAANPDDAKVVEALDRLASGIEAPEPAGLDTEAALRRVKARHREAPVLSLDRGRGLGAPAPRWWQSPGVRVAAVLAVAVLGTLVVRSRTGGGPPAVAVEVRTHHAGIGKPDSVGLPDGSQVVLAPGSELGVPATYGADRREVTLVGQAWFRVRHDDGKPFVVRSSGTEVRDVGTVFTVRGDSATAVRVSVHEGAVLVRGDDQAPDQGVLLHQGDEAVLGRAGVTTVARGTVSAEDADWVSGRLHFRDVPLGEFAATLRRWYGVDVRVADTGLAGRRISTDANAGTVDAALREVALAVGGQLVRRGDTVFVGRR